MCTFLSCLKNLFLNLLGRSNALHPLSPHPCLEGRRLEAGRLVRSCCINPGKGRWRPELECGNGDGKRMEMVCRARAMNQ